MIHIMSPTACRFELSYSYSVTATVFVTSTSEDMQKYSSFHHLYNKYNLIDILTCSLTSIKKLKYNTFLSNVINIRNTINYFPTLLNRVNWKIKFVPICQPSYILNRNLTMCPPFTATLLTTLTIKISQKYKKTLATPFELIQQNVFMRQMPL